MEGEGGGVIKGEGWGVGVECLGGLYILGCCKCFFGYKGGKEKGRGRDWVSWIKCCSYNFVC